MQVLTLLALVNVTRQRLAAGRFVRCVSWCGVVEWFRGGTGITPLNLECRPPLYQEGSAPRHTAGTRCRGRAPEL